MPNDDFAFLKAAWISDAGLRREQNEDALLAMPRQGCFVVADGMGGGEAGEVASRIIVETVAEAFAAAEVLSPGERKFLFQQCLRRARNGIVAFREQRQFSSMGSTVAGVLFDPWDPCRAWSCHVGDSRVYCLREGELFRITMDHSVGAVMRRGKVDMKQIRAGWDHVLTRVIGSGCLLPEWNELGVAARDLFLICSDGVYNELDEDCLAALLGSADSIGDKLEELRCRILRNGARDNFTMIGIEIAGALPPARYVPEIERRESDFLLQVAERGGP